ncbi:MAG: hypothetical protein JWO74_4289, partial [Solirubrobacterales bacterium]|nr:hypothetical protein [Solirubrobacterales bacterium]
MEPRLFRLTGAPRFPGRVGRAAAATVPVRRLRCCSVGLTRKTGLTAVVVIVLSAVAGGAVAVADPVVMAAGDIACAATGPTSPGTCSQAYTANLLLAQKSSAEGLAAVLTLGDNQYE